MSYVQCIQCFCIFTVHNRKYYFVGSHCFPSIRTYVFNPEEGSPLPLIAVVANMLGAEIQGITPHAMPSRNVTSQNSFTNHVSDVRKDYHLSVWRLVQGIN